MDALHSVPDPQRSLLRTHDGRPADTKNMSALSKMVDKGREEQFDVFLKMFLTQVQNQDPTNPMNSNEMTQNIMMFLSAAEQAKGNELLEKIHQGQQAAVNSQARSYLNKEVEYEGDVFAFDGYTPHRIRWNMPEEIQSASLVIYRADGMPIEQTPIDVAGANAFVWDGGHMLQEGGFPPGQYLTRIIAYDAAGEEREVPTIHEGRVERVHYTEDQQTLLSVGGAMVPMEYIISTKKLPSHEILELSEQLKSQLQSYESVTELLGRMGTSIESIA